MEFESFMLTQEKAKKSIDVPIKELFFKYLKIF